MNAHLHRALAAIALDEARNEEAFGFVTQLLNGQALSMLMNACLGKLLLTVMFMAVRDAATDEERLRRLESALAPFAECLDAEVSYEPGGTRKKRKPTQAEPKSNGKKPRLSDEAGNRDVYKRVQVLVGRGFLQFLVELEVVLQSEDAFQFRRHFPFMQRAGADNAIDFATLLFRVT